MASFLCILETFSPSRVRVVSSLPFCPGCSAVVQLPFLAAVEKKVLIGPNHTPSQARAVSRLGDTHLCYQLSGSHGDDLRVFVSLGTAFGSLSVQ